MNDSGSVGASATGWAESAELIALETAWPRQASASDPTAMLRRSAPAEPAAILHAVDDGADRDHNPGDGERDDERCDRAAGDDHRRWGRGRAAPLEDPELALGRDRDHEARERGRQHRERGDPGHVLQAAERGESAIDPAVQHHLVKAIARTAPLQWTPPDQSGLPTDSPHAKRPCSR
jgi:hypothetical protein